MAVQLDLCFGKSGDRDVGWAESVRCPERGWARRAGNEEPPRQSAPPTRLPIHLVEQTGGARALRQATQR